MENNEVDSLIGEFCTKLREYIPEFEELAQARRDLENDPDSKKLWIDKEEQRQTIDLMKSKGLPVSKGQEQKLALRLKEMRENPITMRYLKAINYASKISGKIGAQLEEIVGVDFAPRRGCK